MARKKVDIRPGVSVLAVLRYLNYKHWFALGEFVDNAVESFNKHCDKLKALYGGNFKLKVEIDIDSTSPVRISIRDNAAGIFDSEYERAFRPAAIPDDRSGLSEFGMGMKSAACWFAPRWSVRTSALGESVERFVFFDINNIVNDEIEELVIKESIQQSNTHYTEIVLEEIYHVPVGRTITKIKDHLTDIYRVFIRKDMLELWFNGEKLSYQEPKMLKTPHYKEKDGKPRLWCKEIAFDFGDGLSAHGFAALLEKGSTAKAGFSLFRRDRLIEGSGDEGYRPNYIFGRQNSYCYQRLFGELHLDGFEVSHTKDGFRWDENEQPFLDLLREYLDREDLPLLKQADKYRVRATRDKQKKIAKQAVKNTVDVMESALQYVLPVLADAELVETSDEEKPHTATLANRQFDVKFRDRNWSINVELTNDPVESQWLTLSDSTSENTKNSRRIDIRVSMDHPFMIRFAQNDAEDVDAVLRIAAALALAEVVARESGVRKSGTVRRNVNEILNALSEP